MSTGKKIKKGEGIPLKTKSKKLLDSITSAGLTSPKIITLMITNACNLACRHCLPESFFHNTSHPVPVDAIKKLIKDFTRLGAKEICLTGGEPLMHPAWFEILSFACRQKDLKKVRLQTNGTLLTEVDIEALCSIDSESLMIQVSLEGSTAKTNDMVRGPGSFEQVIRGLKLLTDAGLSQQVVVAFTEMQHNFKELPNLLQLLNELGIGHLVSGTLLLGGRAVRDDHIALPTPIQYTGLLDLYHADPQFRSLYKKFGNIAALEWFKGKSYPANGCCSCIEKPIINVNGEMYPCLMLPIENLAVKGAYQRPLHEVISEGLLLWGVLSDLHLKRSVGLEGCNNCPGRQHCAGGCMGRAYTSTGDFMNAEDRCALRKEVYSWEAAIK